MTRVPAREVSPSAAAAVARVLCEAGVPQAREVSYRMFTEGFWPYLREDHVSVQWDGAWGDEREGERIAAGLELCRVMLDGRGYELELVERSVTVPGGYEDRLVLEVRKAAWTRRGG